MSVGKEYIHVLSELEEAQVRIYDDACDIGLYATDAIAAKIRWALEGLKEFEGGKAEIYGHTRSYTVRLGLGYASESTVEGYEVVVAKSDLTPHLYYRTNKDPAFRHFYTIQINHKTWPKGERLGSTR